MRRPMVSGEPQEANLIESWTHWMVQGGELVAAVTAGRREREGRRARKSWGRMLFGFVWSGLVWAGLFGLIEEGGGEGR